MKVEEKFSKLFATLLLLEEHQRIMKSRIDELSTFRMAQRATNLVQLLASERRDVDQDLAYMREILNAALAPHPDPQPKAEPVNQRLLGACKRIATSIPASGELAYCKDIARAAIAAAEMEMK